MTQTSSLMRGVRTLSWALIVVAAGFVMVRGILPAFRQIDTDFPNYYTAGLIARTGSSHDRLYDDVWFEQQMRQAGFVQSGKFSPFPPPTALLFIPLSSLQPLDALRAVTILNLIMVFVAAVVLKRVTSLPYAWIAALVAFSGWGLANCFRFGQLYIAVSLSIIAAWLFLQQRNDLLAGISAGILLPIKYFPAILFVPAVAQRRWIFLFSGVATCTTVVALSIAVLGWDIHEQWLSVVLGHLQGTLSQQNPYSPTFQSFHSLFRRLFVYDSALNPYPLLDSPVLHSIAVYGSLALVASLVLVAVTRNHAMTRSPDLTFAVLCIAGLLSAPATATYHLLLLWLPMGILIRHFLQSGAASFASATMAIHGIIGFLPYSVFHRYDGQGVWTFLAYPRLWLLFVLLLLGLAALHRRAG